jgi:ABC-2 type transport system ATP-binding protein
VSGSSRRWFALSIAVVALAAGASCSSSSPKASSPAGSTTTSAPDTYTRPACDPRAAQDVVATPVADSTSDYDITSFDGTKIRAHWFPVADAGSEGAPTVLKGPGWGLAGDVNTEGSGYGLFGDLSISSLNGEGYNVLTWDPRGFGASEGVVETNSPDFEGRDVQRLIDWVATQSGVELDAANDPRVGMVGASYGGGIQLTVASIDCRVDAIVPQLAWNSLGTSLYKNDTAKTGWGNLLYGVAGEHQLDPHITSAHTESNASGVISDEDVEWFASRGPGDAVADITAPTLFEQGTIDTLFTLDEAVANYRILKDRGVPTAMLWMCSGHGVCLTEAGDEQLAGSAALAWLNRYVKGDTSVSVGPSSATSTRTGSGTRRSRIHRPPATPSSPPVRACWPWRPRAAPARRSRRATQARSARWPCRSRRAPRRTRSKCRSPSRRRPRCSGHPR